MASTLIKATIGITAGTAAIRGGATIAYLNSGNSKEEQANENNKTIQSAAPIDTLTPKQPKAITELLREKGLSILLDDATEWGENWTKFKADYEAIEPKNEWAFTNWTEVKAKTNDTSDLKTKCATNKTKEALDDTSPLYQSVVKYCTNQSS